MSTKKPAIVTEIVAITTAAKRGRKPAPEGEDKASRFIRLANPRVCNVIQGLQSLAKLSASGYEYTEAQSTKIIEAIRAELDNVEASLCKVKATKGAKFSL